jgi:SAM-dependent methyltransferase
MSDDVWSTGAAYEPYVGRWSRIVASRLLSWLDVAPDGRWVDVGCGTGALTRAVLEEREPREVIGVDPSATFLGYARQTVTDPRARFEEGSATALPLPDDSADAVVSGLVLNFVPDPPAAVREMARVGRPEAVVGAYVWDYAEGMQLMRHFWAAAAAVDPAAEALDEATRFPLCRPEPLRDLFAAGGLTDVQVEAIDIPTPFASFEDYWAPFRGGVGPAPAYAMALPEDVRERLRDDLRARLPYAEDGSVPLTARAWAVRGRC